MSGVFVGPNDGVDDGLKDGDSDGDVVGLKLGETDGDTDGLSLGDTEGLSLGESDGDGVAKAQVQTALAISKTDSHVDPFPILPSVASSNNSWHETWPMIGTKTVASGLVTTISSSSQMGQTNTSSSSSSSFSFLRSLVG